MNRQLIKTLIIPLIIASAISIIIAFIIPWQGLFVGLATTFIGILITIIYVDWILRVNEKKKWENVHFRLDMELTRFGIIAINEFRTAFNIGSEIVMSIDFSNPIIMRKEMAQMAKIILVPNAGKKVLEMNQSDWNNLSNNLITVINEADRLINLFGNRMDPEIFSLVLEIREKALRIQSMYSLVPNLLGVSDKDLPISQKTHKPMIPEKGFIINSLADDIGELLLFGCSLLEILSMEKNN